MNRPGRKTDCRPAEDVDVPRKTGGNLHYEYFLRTPSGGKNEQGEKHGPGARPSTTQHGLILPHFAFLRFGPVQESPVRGRRDALGGLLELGGASATLRRKQLQEIGHAQQLLHPWREIPQFQYAKTPVDRGNFETHDGS